MRFPSDRNTIRYIAWVGKNFVLTVAMTFAVTTGVIADEPLVAGTIVRLCGVLTSSEVCPRQYFGGCTVEQTYQGYFLSLPRSKRFIDPSTGDTAAEPGDLNLVQVTVDKYADEKLYELMAKSVGRNVVFEGILYSSPSAYFQTPYIFDGKSVQDSGGSCRK